MSSYNQSIKYYNESFKTDDREFYQELMNLIGIQRRCKKHAFILQKESIYLGACHSSDCESTPSVVTCVRCGLTNSYWDYFEHNNYYNPRGDMRAIAFEKEFGRQFPDQWRRAGKSYNISCIRDYLISKEVINTEHPKELYEIAKEIIPNASDEILFKVIQIIEKGETAYEAWHGLTKEWQKNRLKAFYYFTMENALDMEALLEGKPFKRYGVINRAWNSKPNSYLEMAKIVDPDASKEKVLNIATILEKFKPYLGDKAIFGTGNGVVTNIYAFVICAETYKYAIELKKLLGEKVEDKISVRKLDGDKNGKS